MNKYLSIDVGTTCCKCQLFNETGDILEYISKEYSFKDIDGQNYIDIVSIKDNVLSMIKEVCNKHTVSSLCVSSFGESFVLLDENDDIVFYPMLYTDPRGDKEAKEFINKLGEEYIFKTTGLIPQAMFSLCKLMYIRNNYPEAYNKGNKAFQVCDYIGYVLTNERVIDYSLASRTCGFDIEKLEYDDKIFNTLNIDKDIFSKPMPTGTIVGNLRKEIKEYLNIDYDIKLILGSQDQVLNAVGSFCLKPGDATDGIGTVECITPVFDFKSDDIQMAKEGYPIVPFLDTGMYCTYICNYASNSITNWFKNELEHNYKGNSDDFFNYIEEKMNDDIDEIYCLPYFAGSCIPYQDLNAKGAFIGLTTFTSDAELYKSIIESLAMEMRFEVENGNKFGIRVNKLIATGGGSLSKKRLQLKADIENVKVETLMSQEGGLCGGAVIQSVSLKQFSNYEDACNCFVKIKDTYIPDIHKHNKYEEKYNKYLKMYKNIKNILE